MKRHLFQKSRVLLPILVCLFLLAPRVYGQAPQRAYLVRGVKSPQDLVLDDQKTDLKGFNFEGYNYYRLRDLAQVLEGKLDFQAQGDHQEIHLNLGQAYQSLGDRDQASSASHTRALVRDMRLVLHQEGRDPQVFYVKAANIEGFNYFKLRDLAGLLDFNLAYDPIKDQALIRTSLPEEDPGLEPGERVILGNENLFTEDYKYLIDGKRLGLITNQTGVDGEGLSTAYKLKAYEGAQLVALYSPEHGLDGNHKAGAWVESYFDSQIGLPVYSLYGQSREPSLQMLKGVEVLVFDMQDIGSRTYTYMSTLNYAMRAAAKAQIPLVVLDRPNPLGGEKVEGYMIEDRFISFVGVDKMPMAHGMTAGELAGYFNRKIGADLRVVPLKNWKRSMVWQDTGLPFKQTSPNIPNLESAFMYMATGSGEGTGIGQADYFHWVGGKNLNSQEYARRLNEAGLEGVRFIPQNKGNRGGVRLEVTNYRLFNPMRTGVYSLAIANQMRPVTVPPAKKPYPMFYKILGTEKMATALREKKSPREIVLEYQADVEAFKAIREPYLLYD
ncbi:MAG: DUF1343 domain-containing protein [Tissierellia bacterium]|nr:DUF1343 domain-containing protein [Tissierellia bacterium]